MNSRTSNTPTPATEAGEAHQVEAQFAGLDNDLVQIETAEGRPEPRDETLNAEDVDETSAGGLQYPPDVRTSGGGSAR